MFDGLIRDSLCEETIWNKIYSMLGAEVNITYSVPIYFDRKQMEKETFRLYLTTELQEISKTKGQYQSLFLFIIEKTTRLGK